MDYEIQAKISKKTRIIVIYSPSKDELDKIEKAIKDTLKVI